MPPARKLYLTVHEPTIRGKLLCVLWPLLAFCGGLVAGPYIHSLIELRGFINPMTTLRELEQAKFTIDQLNRRIALYENASQVDRLAVKNTHEDMKALQDKLLEAEKELEFYRRIVSPENRDDDLRIQGLRIRGQQIALTLSQGIGRDAPIQAHAAILFSGRLNGQETALNLEQVDREKRSRLEFSFRYFQTETVELELPDGFVLEHATVTVAPDQNESKSISRDWTIQEMQAG